MRLTNPLLYKWFGSFLKNIVPLYWVDVAYDLTTLADLPILLFSCIWFSVAIVYVFLICPHCVILKMYIIAYKWIKLNFVRFAHWNWLAVMVF